MELGDLHARDRNQAKKLYEIAKELLQELPHNASIDCRQEKISRDRLLAHVEQKLNLSREF